MTRTMYDAVTNTNIPADATLVAAYVNGHYTNYAQAVARFPHATVVGISVTARFNAGIVLDVEQGDARPDEAPDWVLMRRAAGIDPTVYCDSSTWPSVREAFTSRHLPEPHYWIAQYDGDPTIPAGAVAKQYADPGPYDLSSVADHWPGVDNPEGDIVLDSATLDPIVTAVWYHPEVDTATGQTTPMEAFLRYQDQLRDRQTAQILTALKGITDLLGQLLAKPVPMPAALTAADVTATTAATAETPTDGYTAPNA